MKKAALILVLLIVNEVCCSQVWQWAKSGLGVYGYHDDASSIGMDSLGNMYVTGFFCAPTIKFDAITLNNPGASVGLGPCNYYLVKYDPSGNVLWAKASFGNSIHQYATSLKVEKSGSVYLAGTFQP